MYLIGPWMIMLLPVIIDVFKWFMDDNIALCELLIDDNIAICDKRCIYHG